MRKNNYLIEYIVRHVFRKGRDMRIDYKPYSKDLAYLLEETVGSESNKLVVFDHLSSREVTFKLLIRNGRVVSPQKVVVFSNGGNGYVLTVYDDEVFFDSDYILEYTITGKGFKRRIIKINEGYERDDSSRISRLDSVFSKLATLLA